MMPRTTSSDREEHVRKVLQGTRLTEIALEEDTLKSAIESDRLTTCWPPFGPAARGKGLSRSRSPSRTEDPARQPGLSKRRLAIELQQNELDLIKLRAGWTAQFAPRGGLVRSPIDGVVTRLIRVRVRWRRGWALPRSSI